MSYRSIHKLRRYWRKYLGVLPLPQAVTELRQWFKTPLGTALLTEEQQLIDRSLQCLFGYHLLQLSINPDIDLTQSSRISHKFALHPQLATNPRLSALADFTKLPLPNDSMDVILLHHSLDFSEQPHQLLREATQLLIPRGHLLIVGFNRWSWWGLFAWIARFFSRKALWRHQSLRIHRVVDWLTLLDVETLEVQQGFYRPPIQRAWLLKHLHWLEAWGTKLRLPWGGFYVILACKDRCAMTPVKLTWPGTQRTPIGGLSVTKILGRVQVSSSIYNRRF